MHRCARNASVVVGFYGGVSGWLGAAVAHAGALHKKMATMFSCFVFKGAQALQYYASGGGGQGEIRHSLRLFDYSFSYDGATLSSLCQAIVCEEIAYIAANRD